MTPAVLSLERSGVAHRCVSYAHDPDGGSYGQEAARALGVDPGAVLKTLVVALDDGSLAVAVVPVSKRLDLRAFARTAGAKKATMADVDAAERSTGYVIGGISPFGQRQALRTFVDATAADYDEVFVSGGRRGLEVAVAPDAFDAVIESVLFAPITTD